MRFHKDAVAMAQPPARPRTLLLATGKEMGTRVKPTTNPQSLQASVPLAAENDFKTPGAPSLEHARVLPGEFSRGDGLASGVLLTRQEGRDDSVSPTPLQRPHAQWQAQF